MQIMQFLFSCNSILHPPSQFVCLLWGIQLFNELKMLHFKSFNFSKLTINNLKLPKSGKVKMPLRFKRERAKPQVTTFWWLTF